MRFLVILRARTKEFDTYEQCEAVMLPALAAVEDGPFSEVVIDHVYSAKVIEHEIRFTPPQLALVQKLIEAPLRDVVNAGDDLSPIAVSLVHTLRMYGRLTQLLRSSKV